MFHHFTFAVNGLKPNFKTFNVASFGFDFDVEITVEPKDTGGGGKPFGLPDYTEYVVTVKVRYKDKTWITQREVNNLGLATLEKVVASFATIVRISDSVKIFVQHAMSRISSIININTRYKSKNLKGKK
jgi:hypothetical protein